MPGVLYCLAAAVASGAMGIFGKLAFEEGASVGTVLAARFAFAAAILWLVACARRGSFGAVTRRDVVLALGLGAVGYAAQAGGYFAALARLDASLLALLVYTFPVLVAVAAVALGRERLSRRTTLALVVASGGLLLVLASASGGGVADPAGVALGLGCAMVYATYILASDGIAGRLSPLPLATLVCTGAAVTLTVGALVVGDLRPADVSLPGLGWLAAIAAVSTVGAIALFFAGLRRVGPTGTSILSTLEPVVTVSLAYVAFADRLAAPQLAGAALVLIGAALSVRQPVRPPSSPIVVSSAMSPKQRSTAYASS